MVKSIPQQEKSISLH